MVWRSIRLAYSQGDALYCCLTNAVCIDDALGVGKLQGSSPCHSENRPWPRGRIKY